MAENFLTELELDHEDIENDIESTEPEAQPTEEPAEPEDPEPTEPAEPEPAPVTTEMFNNLVGLITQSNIDRENLKKEILELKTSSIKEPVAPEITVDDFDEDPNAAIDKKLKYNQELQDFNQKKQSLEAETQETDFKANHKNEFMSYMNQLPVLQTPEGRQGFDSFYTGKGYHNQPDGMSRAFQDFLSSNLSKGINPYLIDISKPVLPQAEAMMKQAQGNIPPADTAPTPEEIAADNAARQARTSSASLNTSTGTETSVPTLNAGQADAARKMGVDPKEYAKTLAMINKAKENRK